MRNSLILGVALLLGCGTSTCKETTPRLEPPVTRVPEPTPVLTAAPVEEVIDWKTPPEVLEIGVINPKLCIMAYFSDVINNDQTIETTVFTDQDFILLVNKTFIAMKFPMTKELAPEIMAEFKITKLPALIMAPANDELVLQVEGNVPVQDLMAAIGVASQEGEIFENCVKEKTELPNPN